MDSEFQPTMEFMRSQLIIIQSTSARLLFCIRKFPRIICVYILVQLYLLSTKGDQLKIGAADRTLRETLEKRLEETPSNARCFGQGSSLMC
jgi:hypothetical protein